MTDSKLYEDFKSKITQIRPVIALLSFKHWICEKKPTADSWLLESRGVNWETAMNYPSARGWKNPVEWLGEEPDETVVKRKRGRPKGSKNKPKRPEPKRRGRPRNDSRTN